MILPNPISKPVAFTLNYPSRAGSLNFSCQLSTIRLCNLSGSALISSPRWRTRALVIVKRAYQIVRSFWMIKQTAIITREGFKQATEHVMQLRRNFESAELLIAFKHVVYSTNIERLEVC